MTTKNFGAGVSPYLDVDRRNFETTVYQQSKPVLDAELNLSQDVDQARARSVLQLAQSGWLNADVLDTSSHSAGIYVASGTSNLYVTPPLKALVNGWVIPVSNTGPTGIDYNSPPEGYGEETFDLLNGNSLELSAGPAGAGALRTDLVILEVWRRLLSANPSTVGKSHSARIWRNGNVKINASDDFGLNYPDDILHPFVAAETTRRVQIQYRLRVIEGIDLDGYPSGIADPVVVAFTVPGSAVDPDGTATEFAYESQSPAGDGGLWRAGDGNPANEIGSVDGYMYALPLAAIFRRNTTAFHRDTNHNGGSGRPDGLTADIIDERDVFDLRTSVSTMGWDLQEMLSKSVNLILDNALRTELTTTPLGGGSKGHTNIWADEIGPTDNAGAQQIRTAFDGVCRRFSDRPILETVTVRYQPTDQVGGGASWTSSSVIVIDPTGVATAFRIYPHANANFINAAPDNIVILDVISVVEANSAAGTFVLVGAYEDPTTGISHALVSYEYCYVSGLGAAGSVEFRFNSSNFPAGSDVYVTLLVSYPGGAESTAGGLSRTPTGDFGEDSFVLETPAQLPATAPYLFEEIEASIDQAHREAAITYRTLTATFAQRAAEFTSLADLPPNTFPIYIPDRVAPTPTPTLVNTTEAVSYTGSVSVSNDGHFLVVSDQAADWNGTAPTPGVDVITTSYKAIRAIPNNSIQMTIWYETRAAQTIRTALLGTSLTVVPRYVAPHLYTLVNGSGSLDEAYPFPQQYVQGPGVYPSSGGSYSGDHELAGLGVVSISDFSASTGFLQVPVLVPAVPNPQSLTFLRDGGDVDIEGRSFFKEVPAGYIPCAFGQPLSDRKRHKNILPMLAELSSDGPIGPRGTLVLVLLSRWSEFDADNFVGFDSDLALNFTSASVYRLKGNPLNSRRA